MHFIINCLNITFGSLNINSLFIEFTIIHKLLLSLIIIKLLSLTV